MKGTACLSGLTKQNVKKLFKSQPTLIFAIDVCLRGGLHHLQTAQIKHCRGKRKKKYQGPKSPWSPCSATDAGSRKQGTEVRIYVYHRTANCLSCNGKDRLLSYRALNNYRLLSIRKGSLRPSSPSVVSPASTEHLGIKKWCPFTFFGTNYSHPPIFTNKECAKTQTKIRNNSKNRKKRKMSKQPPLKKSKQEIIMCSWRRLWK